MIAVQMRDEDPINIRVGYRRGHDLSRRALATIKQPRRRLLAVGVEP